MKKSLYLVGAGGFGRELAFWLEHHPEANKRWAIAGFLDDNPQALEGYDFPYPIVGDISTCQPGPNDLFICAIGVPGIKKQVVTCLQTKGARFISFVHPSVVVGGKVTLGEGVVLCPGVILTSCLTVGNFVMINCHSSAGHDCTIGDFCTISGHCDLTSFTTLEQGVFLGTGARLLPRIKVGAGATIGAGSVVIHHVKEKATVFGNPARRLFS